MTTASAPAARIVAFIVAGEGPHLIAPGLVNPPSTPEERDGSGSAPAITTEPATPTSSPR